MTTAELSESTFEDTITGNDIVLADWWASWCGPCHMFAPIFEHAAAANPDLVFGKVDTEAHQRLAGAFNIRSIPPSWSSGSRYWCSPKQGPSPPHGRR